MTSQSQLSTKPDLASVASANSFGSRPAVIKLLAPIRSEVRKLTSVRSTFVTIGIILGISSVFTAAVYHFAPDDEQIPIIGAPFLSIFFINLGVTLLGAFIGSLDFAHKTIVPTLAHRRRMLEVIAGKVGAVLVVSVTVQLAISLVVLGVASIFSGPNGGSTTELGQNLLVASGWTFFGSAMLALVGLGVGLLTRSTAACIGSILGMWAGEPIILASGLPLDYLKYSLFTSNLRMLGFTDNGERGDSFAITSEMQAGAVVCLIWVAVIIGAGVIRNLKSDVV